jgi:hypothetical protein
VVLLLVLHSVSLAAASNISVVSYYKTELTENGKSVTI